MPCRSDYMEPTHTERRLQETAILLGYALVEMNQKVTGRVANAANDQYCTTDLVPDLCALIRSMTAEEKDRIVYNARDKRSRQLANWWEEHEAADKAREEKERREATRDWAIRRVWEEETQTVWPRPGDYASVSEDNIMAFAKKLLDNPPKGR